MSEPLRVLGWASLFDDDEEPCAVSLFEADLRHSRGETVVPLVNGTAAEAERARLVALLRRARLWVNYGKGISARALHHDIEQELAKHE